MTLQDKLFNDYAIRIKNQELGGQKTKCPQCQPAHNMRDNPLSVTVEVGTILFNCHHCGFSGGVVDSGFKPTRRKTPEPVAYLSAPNKFLDDYFAGRGISRPTYEAFNIFTEDNNSLNVYIPIFF